MGMRSRKEFGPEAARDPHDAKLFVKKEVPKVKKKAEYW